MQKRHLDPLRSELRFIESQNFQVGNWILNLFCILQKPSKFYLLTFKVLIKNCILKDDSLDAKFEIAE